MRSGTAAPRARRVATLIAGIGITAAIGLSAQPVQAATTTESAPAAAGWLANQLVEGERLEQDLGDAGVFPDQGATLDAVLAFAAAGVAGDSAEAALSWLSDPDIAGNYLGTEFDSAFAGAHAKLIFVLQVYGEDPTAFNGQDLVSTLRGLQDADGRFVDDSEFGDYSNGFSQTFAILALAGTAEGVPGNAVDFLVSEQCEDGGIPLLFEEDTCTGDVDATGMAAQALLAVGATEPATAALDWLESQQHDNGGFGGSPPTGAINANSTGLALQGLRAGDRDAAGSAEDYLRGLQVGCEGAEPDQGAIAYDESGFDPATAIRATTQAVLGLSGVALPDLDGTAAVPGAPVLECESGAEPTPTPDPTTAPPPVAGAGGEKLPVTGNSALTLVGIGLLLAAIGAAAVWATRKRGTEAEPEPSTGEAAGS